MKRFFKYNNKVIGLAVAALTFAACADQWDDHYSDAALPGTNSGTIWQAMEQNPELSNFRRVAEACGYDKALKSSQAFTVFAPLNKNFSETQADSVIAVYNEEVAAGTRLTENRAIKEFLQNHIARYTYSVAKETKDSLVMMNGKYLLLTQNDFGGKKLQSVNQLYENGVLFTLDEPTNFYNNVFELVEKMRAKNGEAPAPDGLDSVYNFLYSNRYYRYELDEEKSVPGDIVNGKTTYLDSVMVKYNELFYNIGYLNSEDSTYWMVAPTNAEFGKYLSEYQNYFMYHEKVERYDSLRWFMPRIQMMASGIFSMTRNTALKNHIEKGTPVDSVLTTWASDYKYRKSSWGSDTLHYYQYGTMNNPKDPFGTGGVFNGTTNTKCSNGMLLKANQWNVDKKETFLRTIVVEAENASRIIIDDNHTDRRAVAKTVPSYSKYYNRVSNNRYLEVYPYNASIDMPEITFLIPNVLSGVKYDIYLVTVPANAVDTLVADEDLKPSLLVASRFYKELDGSGMERDSIENRLDKIFRDKKYFLGRFEGAKGKGYGSGLDVDTICLSENVEFPTCSWGTRSEVQIRLINYVESKHSKTYDRTMRLDCIIFRPHDFGPLPKRKIDE